MKKYILFFLLPVLIGGCEKTYNDVIDAKIISYQVISTSIESVNSDSLITYSPFDSLITIRLKINSSKDINGIYCSIVAPDGNPLNSSQIQLLDNGNAVNGDSAAGDNIYSNKFPMSRNDIVGLYTVNFFVTDAGNSSKITAVQSFVYDNGQSNLPPQLTNLVAPDTVAVVSPKSVIFLSVVPSDPNGRRDVKSVYFISYKPDGSTSGNKNELLDDGNFKLDGDIQAGDGLYSILIEVTPQNTKGTYRFDFQAMDWGGALSDILSHNIVIK